MISLEEASGMEKELFFMKSFSKFLGIIAIMALIGFVMTACSSDDDKFGNLTGGGDGTSGGSTGLTITGIPSEYNGKYAYAEGGTYGGSYLIGAESMNMVSETGRAAQISNGRVRLNVWSVNEYSGMLNSYNGSGYAMFMVLILNSSQMNESTLSNEYNFAGLGGVEVNFSNGTGTGAFEDYGGYFSKTN